MNNKEIKILINLEKLHRYVFDTFYVQSYKIVEADRKVIDEYNNLCELYPEFRKKLPEIYIEFYDIKKSCEKLGKSFPDEEILKELEKINFIRYSLSNEIKNRLKEIKEELK